MRQVLFSLCFFLILIEIQGQSFSLSFDDDEDTLTINNEGSTTYHTILTSSSGVNETVSLRTQIGDTIDFHKTAFADFLLPENQDMVSDLVILTRGNVQGLFNILAESQYTKSASPRWTKWSAKEAILSVDTDYGIWLDAVGGAGSTDDQVGTTFSFYTNDPFSRLFNVTMTHWGVTASGGGEVGYRRIEIPKYVSIDSPDRAFTDSTNIDLTIDVSGVPTGIYSFDLMAKQNNGIATKTIWVEVLPPVPPEITDQQFSVDENSSNGTLIDTLMATDVDSDELFFFIISGNENGTFALDSVTGIVSILNNSMLDFETFPEYTLVVEVSDGALTDSASLTIQIADINESPQLIDQQFTVDENSPIGTLVDTVTATDPENNSLLFTITAGNEHQTFMIEASTGILTVLNDSTIDFETNPNYDLLISVTDGEFVVAASVAIEVINVEEDPIIEAQQFTINENSPIGAVVGTIVASDPNGDVLTYSIDSANDMGVFELDSSTALLTVSDNTLLDFEQITEFTLQIHVTDGKHTASADISIQLIDVNEAPEINDQLFNLDENSDAGTPIETVVASDVDGDILIFTIGGGNEDENFIVDANTGELVVVNGAHLDFESKDNYVLVVNVSDGELNSQADITITLNDVNDAPELVDGDFAVDENSSDGTLIGTINGSDQDGDELTYSIVTGDDGGAFSLNASSGELTVGDFRQLNFEITPNFNLTIEVNDGVLTSTANYDISINNVDETLGITDLKPDIYPNPVQDLLSIEWIQFEQAVINELSGKQLIRSGSSIIDVSNLKAGVYILTLTGKNYEVLKVKLMKR